MVSHLCKLMLAFLTLICKSIHMPWNQPKLVKAWTFGMTSKYLQDSLIFWLFCLISELLGMLVHFQANRQIPGSNFLVFISTCHCCVFDTYLKSFSIPLAHSVVHGNQKSNKQWIEVWKIWNAVFYMRKKPWLFVLHTVSLKTLKLIFLIMWRIYTLIERIHFIMHFGYLFFFVYLHGILLQILILTKISQLQREYKCLENSILLLQSTQFGELIIFLLSPLWFCFWQAILLHTDWLISHHVKMAGAC